MSYTAPQYVDTKEQAILALASVIADEDKGALGDGSVNKALDVLADVLANQDVQVPQTNAGAILALADYVSGGGGGGGETFDIYLMYETPDIEKRPETVRYVTGLTEGNPDPVPSFASLEFEPITVQGISGILVKGCRAGMVLDLDWGASSLSVSTIGYGTSLETMVISYSLWGGTVPDPIDGWYIIGFYMLDA